MNLPSDKDIASESIVQAVRWNFQSDSSRLVYKTGFWAGANYVKNNITYHKKKPLSELIDNIDALQSIFRKATYTNSQLWHTINNNAVTAAGNGYRLIITYSGTITIYKHAEVVSPECSMFELIDLIRELGYEPQSKD